MEMLETDYRARLMAENEEYRRLAQQHREYEKQLEQLAHRRPFTQQDWFEEHVVKKLRLQVKDRMATIAKESTVDVKTAAHA